MSAQPGPMPTEVQDDLDLMVKPSAYWRAQICSGCGQRPDDLARLDAIAVTVFLQRRFESLLAHPERSLRHRGPGRGSWSAMEPAAKVSDVLSVATDRLRTRLGDQTAEGVPPAIGMKGSAASPQIRSAVLDSLAETVRRLTATIAGATTEAWRRPGPDNGATAGELVWLALHDATHHLEDAELLLDAASATDAVPRPVTDIRAGRHPTAPERP